MSAASPPEGSAAGESSPRSAWPDARTTRWLLAGIVLLAFVVRLVYVLQVRASPFFDAPVMDPAYHVDWARAFAAGERFQEGPFFRAPLYPWFLGLSFELFGEDLLVPRLLQCLFGVCTTLLVYLLGRDAFDRRAGLLGALGAATYWVLVYFDGELLIPTLAIPLDLLALWLTLRLGAEPRPRPALLAGLAWGLAAIARPNVLLFMPVLFFWVLRRAWSDRRRAALAAGALTLGTLVPIAPLSAYNAAQGDFALIATQAGVNLWIGNNPDHAARGDVSTAIVPGTRPGWWEGYHDAVAQANAAAGPELRPSEVSDYYSGLAWDWIRSNPGDAFAHWLLKLRLFWSAEELGNNQPIRGFAHRFGPITRLLPLGFPVVAALGLLGLGLSLVRREDRARLLPLWGFVVVYTLGVVAFFVNGRFRLPVVPVLLVLGAHATLWLVTEARARRFGRVGGAAVAVALGLLLTLSTPAKYRQDEATTAYQLGVAAEQAQQVEAALEHYARALELRETFVQAYTRRGMLLTELRRVDEAEAELAQALELAPADREALEAAIRLKLLQPQTRGQALPLAEHLVRAHPSYATAYDYLGFARAQAGDLDAAVQAYRDGLQVAPREAALHLGLGRVLGQAGDVPRAAEAFRAGLALAPRDPGLLNGLANVFVQQERWGDAVEPLLEAYRVLAGRLQGGGGTPEDEQAYWRNALQLYQMLHAAGRAEEGERFLQELAAKHPGDRRVEAVRQNRPR